MFGIDSPELLVIAIVALVVIGPKEFPTLLRSWGKWMAKMRGMASEFRGHVDEMVRQSELDQVKKQLESSISGVDVAALDPTKEFKQHLQDGMAEGEKALADAKASLDNPLAEPESAPQIAAEIASDVALEAASAPPPAAPESLAAVEAPVPVPSHDDKPKAAAAS
ncbi:MAG: Sec-independent protein translocase protein TatB [Enhydrobacter sp.]